MQSCGTRPSWRFLLSRSTRPIAAVKLGSPRRPPTRLGLQLLLDQGLEVVAAQFATRIGLAVDERALRSQHLRGVTPVVWVAPPEVRGDRPVASENAVGIRALLASGDVGTERLGCRPDGIGQAAVGGPMAYRERFEDCVERGPVETRYRLRGIAALVDRADIAEPATVGQAPEPPTFVTDPLT
jgi:hypothetical protein